MVHYFGDSFTEGCGIVKQTKSISASKIDLISPDISKNLLENSLTKLLKEQHYKNYAVGGVCNEDIVSSIYSNINNFDTNDYIVIGTTCAGRKKFYFEDLKSLIDSNEKITEYVFELQMLPTHYDEIDNYLKEEPELSYYHRFDKNTLKAVNLYYKQYLMQDKVIEYEYSIAKKQIKELQIFLSRLNINSILWECDLWHGFETLNSWSKGDIPDGHFSPNSHLQLSHLLYKCFKDGNNHLTKSYVDDNIKKISSSLEYIYYIKEYSDLKNMKEYISSLPAKPKKLPFEIEL